ncbi:MAG: FHA domain-containing protein [Planctomycetota bacterium]
MLKIRLVHRNGDRRGNRIHVARSPFRIGRHESRDLRLEGRQVSRKHCDIVHDERQVYVRDRDSSNGTIVNGNRISKPCRLWHESKIQIGPWKLRVSIREAATNRPLFDPGHETSTNLQSPSVNSSEPKLTEFDQALSELDDLALEFDAVGPSHSRDSMRPETDGSSDPLDVTPNETRSDQQGAANADNAKSRDGDPPPESVSTTIETDIEEPDPSDTTDNDTIEDEGQEERFQRLPSHLLPKRAKDSQDAATEALRRLLGG